MGRWFLVAFLMVCPEVITGIGLLMDIAGVVVLFYKNSFRHVESYISLRLVEASTPGANEERVPGFSSAEQQRRLEVVRHCVEQTQLWLRVGLGLVFVGFLFQALALLMRLFIFLS